MLAWVKGQVRETQSPASGTLDVVTTGRTNESEGLDNHRQMVIYSTSILFLASTISRTLCSAAGGRFQSRFTGL